LTALYLPFVILPLLLVTVGIAWFLAATSVFIRDIAQTTGIFTTVLLFLSPVFFPVSALPEEYRPILFANPLTFIIEQARGALIWNRVPDWSGLAVYGLVSVVFAWAGFWWFQKTRRGFADVL
jgi:lipopolysaccharide transport system permease protein